MDRTTAFLLLIAGCTLAGCSSTPKVVVGSKNFTEQVILGEILAQHIEERTGLAVERKLNLGGTLLAHKALEGGSIDLYPEYTGTALTAVLGRSAAKDPKQVFSTVREGYERLDLEWLDPFGFNNTFAMVVRNGTTIRTLSEAAARQQPWRLGVGYEFIQRPDGLKGLVETYGLRLAGDPVSMDLGLLYPALRSGRIEMGAANSTDGHLNSDAFVVLEDDRNYFPPYECAVVVRSETLRKFPALKAALSELSGLIPAETMRRLNAAVDRDKRDVAAVARELLAELRKK